MYRGRQSNISRRGGYYRQHANRETNRPPSPPRGELLHSLTVKELQQVQVDRVSIRDAKYIASYNWLEADNSVILIPGSPPTWTPLKEARQLNEDKGNYFRDPNSARSPEYPMLPAVKALLAENTGFACQSIDLFACTSTLGSLLRYVRGQGKPFRCWVQVVGNTAFFVRHENSPNETIPDVRGYGHTFPEAYTTWAPEIKGSVSHQRLLSYKLGNLNSIVRFQCDGYLPDKVGRDDQNLSDGITQGETQEKISIDELLQGSRIAPCTDNLNQQDIKTRQAGKRIPQQAVFDLKTRSIRKYGDNTLAEELPRFWLGQIPNFVLAHHSSGIFQNIKVQDVRQDVMEWELDKEAELKCLQCLIEKIISVAKIKDDGKLEVCYKDEDNLELLTQAGDDHEVLPSYLKAHWAESTAAEEQTEGGVEIPRDDKDEEDAWTGTERHLDRNSDSGDSDLDYTACSAEDCGYCGKCKY